MHSKSKILNYLYNKIYLSRAIIIFNKESFAYNQKIYFKSYQKAMLAQTQL